MLIFIHICFSKDLKCPAFCNLRVFDEGHQFEISAGMVISSNRYGMTIVASPNHLCGTTCTYNLKMFYCPLN